MLTIGVAAFLPQHAKLAICRMCFDVVCILDIIGYLDVYPLILLILFDILCNFPLYKHMESLDVVSATLGWSPDGKSS